jgi:hypothetical protein
MQIKLKFNTDSDSDRSILLAVMQILEGNFSVDKTELNPHTISQESPDRTLKSVSMPVVRLPKKSDDSQDKSVRREFLSFVQSCVPLMGGTEVGDVLAEVAATRKPGMVKPQFFDSVREKLSEACKTVSV